MNVLGKPDVYEAPLKDWWTKNLQPLIDGTPEVGELKIKWYTAEAQAEQNGEIVTIEKWDGYGWRQYGLDAWHTVQDLLDLSWKLED
jgi:hypothetical protein